MPLRRLAACVVAGVSMLSFGGCGESYCRSLGESGFGQILGALVCTDEQISGKGPSVFLQAKPDTRPVAIGESVELTVMAFPSSSARPVVGLEWDVNGDGTFEAGAFAGLRQELSSEQLKTSTSYLTPGPHNPAARITDSLGATATASTSVEVTDTEYTPPPDGPDGRLAPTDTPRPDPIPAPAVARSAAGPAPPPGERLAFAVLTGRRARGLGTRVVKGRLQLRYAQPGPLVPAADPSPPPVVQRFLNGRWTLDLRRRRGSVRGLAAVRMGKRRLGCARVRIATPESGPRTGTLKLIGGTGPAARLGLRWSFELASLGDEPARLGGAISYEGRQKPRAPSAACRRLAGLGPRRSR